MKHNVILIYTLLVKIFIILAAAPDLSDKGILQGFHTFHNLHDLGITHGKLKLDRLNLCACGKKHTAFSGFNIASYYFS